MKGLYTKAEAGGVSNFTGKDSAFEEPIPNDTDWVVTTDQQTEDDSVKLLLDKILPLIVIKKS